MTRGSARVLRTLAIDHGVPFVQVGNAWVFSDTAVEQLRRIFAEHCRKAERAGVRPPVVQEKGMPPAVSMPASTVVASP